MSVQVKEATITIAQIHYYPKHTVKPTQEFLKVKKKEEEEDSSLANNSFHLKPTKHNFPLLKTN